MRKSPTILSLLLTTALTACAVGPDYKKPSIETPSAWPGQSAADAKTAKPIAADWWKEFNDPALDKLVEEGLNNNGDLLLAAARVSEARALLSYAKADQLPEFGIQGGAVRTRNSEQAVFGGFAANSKPFNDFSLAAVMNYEIDLWGRLRRASESARAQLMSIAANQDAVRLAVAAEIANSYFNLRALDAQLVVTENTIKSREEAYRYQKAQYDHGAANGLVFTQAEAELAAARAQLPLIRQMRVEQESALAVLLGRSPKDVVESKVATGKEIDAIPTAPGIPPELPSTLLERRPDIKSAEQALVAANAQIGVATAEYFPTISINGLLGLDSSTADNLFKKSARNWQIGANMVGPLFDIGGRASSNVDANRARADQAQVQYQQTVRTAFKEAVDALSAEQNASQRIEAQEAQLTARAEALRLAGLRYDSGYSNYLEVLDAQRFLYQVQLERINAKLDRLRASVNLYKALGGGWDYADTKKTAEAENIGNYEHSYQPGSSWLDHILDK